MQARAVDPELAMRLGSEASADPRTAARAIASGSRAVRGLVAFRLCRAMRALGIDDPAPALVAGSGAPPRRAERAR
jgi:hypothetical protein